MKRYITVGIYGLHRDAIADNDNVQFGLVNGVSYLPNYDSEVSINLHKSVNIEMSEDGAVLKLSIQEAKMLSTVLNNLTNHLEQKINLSRQNLLKDEAYFDEDESIKGI